MFWSCTGNSVDNPGMFCYCWAGLAQCQALFCLSHHPTKDQAVGAQGDGWGHSWGSWSQIHQRDIPYHIAEHRKPREEEERKDFGVMTFFFPSHCPWWSQTFLEIVEHLSANRNCLKKIPVHELFSFFYPSNSLSHHTWGVSRWLCGA